MTEMMLKSDARKMRELIDPCPGEGRFLTMLGEEGLPARAEIGDFRSMASNLITLDTLEGCGA